MQFQKISIPSHRCDFSYGPPSFLDFPKSRYALFKLQKLMFSTNLFDVNSNDLALITGQEVCMGES